MRRVSAIRKDQRLRPRDLPLNRFDMGHSSVFVVFALYHQRGAGDRSEIFFDVPVAKLWVEPDVIPSAKHFVNMIVIPRKFFRQVARFVQLANGPCATQAELLDENVRRLQNESAYPLRPSARINQGDGSAIA